VDVIIIVSCRTWELLTDNERWRLTSGRLVTLTWQPAGDPEHPDLGGCRPRQRTEQTCA